MGVAEVVKSDAGERRFGDPHATRQLLLFLGMTRLPWTIAERTLYASVTKLITFLGCQSRRAAAARLLSLDPISPVLSSSLKKSPSVAISKSISLSSGSEREHACRMRFRLPK